MLQAGGVVISVCEANVCISAIPPRPAAYDAAARYCTWCTFCLLSLAVVDSTSQGRCFGHETPSRRYGRSRL